MNILLVNLLVILILQKTDNIGCGLFRLVALELYLDLFDLLPDRKMSYCGWHGKSQCKRMWAYEDYYCRLVVYLVTTKMIKLEHAVIYVESLDLFSRNILLL